MTNALDFFNFGKMPIFDNWFDNFGLVPTNFTNSPKVNIKETDKAYEIEIANPGFGKDDTKIDVSNGIITVSMNSEEKEVNEPEDKYHVKQWSKSSYQESWKLPENVIEDQISAKHNNGVLTITLPKNKNWGKAGDPRTITIE